ncbi:kinesin-like protein KIN-10C isoform X1 [Citrus clementina]|uniref:kinesin-like protein KIN-10C isoform X1 n=1 Tax=Citrus clementina TaxID=85681 RepID=UPI000CED57D5|nr:kinesin-like protein KIN-10C isoform X1 [Citrus x clementina]
METLKPDKLDRTKADTGLNISKKARVIAKIRGFADLEAESANWVCIQKPNGEDSDSVTVSFGEQPSSRKECYKLDYCYEQNEGNGIIFAREVKPLISEVFNGINATIVACGAKGSGKTRVIQGSYEEPGLAALAVDEILSISEKMGKSITISFYEIFQDHVYDLLDPKQQEVQILENGQGKIQLKGLSQVPVKSISEFQKLYISMHNSRKPVQKITMDLPRRSHKGLIVNVSPVSNFLPTGKMNFVDLAGYQDIRRKSTEGSIFVENTKVNKSIYTLFNVVYALNANESHVPYRESKLTRMLQESLGCKSKILMLTCLSPSFCQDSMYIVSLASRCCQGINPTVSDSTKKTKSLVSSMLLSSHKNQLPRSVSTTKTQTGSQMHSSTKKATGVASAVKGRKLFDEAIQSTKSEKMSQKESSSSDMASTIQSLVEEQGSSVTVAIVDKDSSSEVEKESSAPNAMVDKGLTSIEEKDDSPLAIVYQQETTESDKDSFLHTQENQGKITPNADRSLKDLSLVEERQMIDKENNHLLINKDMSPPLSERLQEISNNLKQLISSTPQCIEIPPKNDTSNIQACADIVEPKTPDGSMIVYEKWEIANMKSPWETFNMRSSGMKNSLVQEYLKLLNTGGKEDLKRLKGIGEKRASYILELREESPEPFKNLDDLKDIGLSAKQIKGMMKKEMECLFN